MIEYNGNITDRNIMSAILLIEILLSNVKKL